MHAGQAFSLAIDAAKSALQDLALVRPPSQLSSAVSSASFPLARLAWHFRMHAISFTQGLRRSGLALRVGRRRDEAGVIATKWRLCTG
jgi:hypothetical protein